MRGIKVVLKKIKEKTRIHSSRMRTVRCSGRLVGRGSAQGGGSAWGCLPRGVSAQGGLPEGVSSWTGLSAQEEVSAWGGVYTAPPVDRQTPVKIFANFVCGR